MADSGTFTVTGGPNNIHGASVNDIPIVVTGLSGPISALTVRVDHFTTTNSLLGLGFLLVAPDGSSNIEFLSESGIGYDVTDQTIYFTDFNDSQHSLTFPVVKPFDRNGLTDPYAGLTLPIPASTINHAPYVGSASFSSAFNGVGADGTWHLYVIADTFFQDGHDSTLGSVSLNIVTNVAPVISAPVDHFTVASGQSLTFSAANGNLPTSVDPDFDSGDFPSLRLTVEHGKISNPNFGFFQTPTKDLGVGAGGADLVGLFLNGLVYTPDPGFIGVDHLTIKLTDNGGFDLGASIGNLTTTKIIDIQVGDPALHPFQWSGSGNLGTHAGGYQVAGVADLNGDGTADVLWRDPVSGKLDSWQLQNGNWSKSIDLGSHGAGWTVAATGDFNGDGTSDILFRETATGKLDAWIMQNGQWSKSVDLGSHGTDWKVIGAGDFNGDGTSDILFQNTTTGAVDEWIMKAGNWLASKSLGAHNAAYTTAAIGDFDGDGTSDVLWHNPTTGAVDEWQIKGGDYAGSIGGFSNYNTAYQLAAVSDFNHDGTSDVLWRNPTSGAVDGWVIDHGKWAGSVSLGTFDPAYKLAGTGDFNHADGADVLWHNQATGQVGTWLLGAV